MPQTQKMETAYPLPYDSPLRESAASATLTTELSPIEYPNAFLQIIAGERYIPVVYPEIVESHFPILIIGRWVDQSGASMVQTLDLNIAQLEEIYTMRKRNEVVNFLRDNLFLIDLLLDAFPHIQEFFGLNPYVTLEVVYDPEATDDRELVASIHTSLPPDEALDRLEQLDEYWWLDALTKAQGTFCINLEFL